MLMVVPGEETPAMSAAIIDAAEADGNGGRVLERDNNSEASSEIQNFLRKGCKRTQ